MLPNEMLDRLDLFEGLSVFFSALLEYVTSLLSSLNRELPTLQGSQRSLACRLGCLSFLACPAQMLPSNPWLPLSATHHNLCRMCGEPTPAAHKSAPAAAYPIASKSSNTTASHSLPAFDATCSPKTVAGRHWSMSLLNSGHKCRSSSVPFRFPAWLKG